MNACNLEIKIRLFEPCDASVKQSLNIFDTDYSQVLGNLVVSGHILSCFAHCMSKTCLGKWNRVLTSSTPYIK